MFLLFIVRFTKKRRMGTGPRWVRWGG